MFLQVRSALEGHLQGPSGAQVALGGQSEGQVESKWRLEASLQSQVASKLRLESGFTGVQGLRTAAGSGCRVQLGGLERLERRNLAFGASTVSSLPGAAGPLGRTY